MSGARLLIDADACPVVEIAMRAARARGVEVLLVCDDAHEMRREGARTVTVARGADSADLRLVNLLEPGDIVVTQDYGLAACAWAAPSRARPPGAPWLPDGAGRDAGWGRKNRASSLMEKQKTVIDICRKWVYSAH